MRKTIKQLEQEVQEAFRSGLSQGRVEEKASFNTKREESKIELVKASAELAQANAKMTYAISRILNKEGW